MCGTVVECWSLTGELHKCKINKINKSIYNNRTGFDLPSDRPYLVQPARSTPFPLTRLPSGALRSAGELRWGDG